MPPTALRSWLHERQLKKGDKALVGNTGYRRFLASTSEDRFAVDYAKAEEDAKFDGVFVLRTNTDLAPLDAMLCYKQLTMVEQTFRTAKSLFATRPIFHKVDETIRGHASCSFLALVLKKELEERIADLGRKGSWPDILADLDLLTETKVEQDDKCFLLRSPPCRRQPRAFRRRRRSPANRPPGRPGLIPTSSSADVVPTRPNASDTPGRSISWISALLKMS